MQNGNFLAMNLSKSEYSVQYLSQGDVMKFKTVAISIHGSRLFSLGKNNDF